MFEEMKKKKELNEDIRELNKKFDVEMYKELKMKLSEGGVNRISVLRRMYRDYDIGSKNWSLYKVKIGKKWFRKCDRKK